jgi:protein prenyltransferase alpha subunit repeat containing protein 1
MEHASRKPGTETEPEMDTYTAIAGAMDADPLIEEIQIVPVDDVGLNFGGDRADFVVFEHKLAIGRRFAAGLRIAGLHVLEHVLSDKNVTDEGRLTIHHATRAILIANTDHYTAWNLRKRWLLQSGWFALRDELRLIALLLTRFPKSGEAFVHRRWVLREMGKAVSAAEMLPVAQGEFEVCSRAAKVYPRNYFAWTHRFWVLSHLSPGEAASESASMRTWSQLNVSDHAGLHYAASAVLLAATGFTHGALAALHASEPPAPEGDSAAGWDQAEWRQTWQLNHDLITRYPGHESLWRQRRMLCWLAHTAAAATHRTPPVTISESKQVTTAAVSKESEFASGIRAWEAAEEQVDNPKWSVREQRAWTNEAVQANQYLRWLEHCFAE